MHLIFFKYLKFWVSVYLFFSVILINYWIIIIIIIKTTLFDMEITITLDNPYTFA